jgi:hypothetical protein
MQGKQVMSFKKELKELLKKYNAFIEFDCADGSDTHGIYGAQIVVRTYDTGRAVLACGELYEWTMNQRTIS